MFDKPAMACRGYARSHRVHFSKGCYAHGIIEGLKHYGLLHESVANFDIEQLVELEKAV